MKSFANFLSIIFHPMMMVTYAATIFFYLIPSDFGFSDPGIPRKIIGMLFASTVIIPVLSMFLMLRFGRISNLQMEQQKERNWPLLQAALIYLGAYYIMHSRVVPIFIQLFLLGSIMGILLSLLINLKWKISLHMIGIGGLCGGIAAEMILHEGGSPVILAISFLTAGILGSARLFLGSHSPAQILAGFLSGFAIEFGLLMLLFPSF